MQRTIQLAVACVALLIATAGQVQAGFVTLSDLQSQTSTGQLFTFTFAGVPTTSDGTGGTLKIGAWGDFSPGASLAETLDFSAEGAVVGTDIRWDLTPNTVLLNSFNFNDNEFVHTVALTGGIVDTLIGDGTVSVTVDFGSGTDLFTANSYASVELTYNSAAVPEPSSLALFGIGACVAGVGAARRRLREKGREATV